MPSSEQRDARSRAQQLLRAARKVFIVYSNEDLERSRDLRRRIIRYRREPDGANVFLAADSIEPGSEVSPARVEQELASADLVVVACGELTATSDFVADEVRQALAQRQQGTSAILPVILKIGCKLPDGLDYSIQAVHIVTLFPSIRWIKIGAAAAGVLLLTTAALLQMRVLHTRAAAEEQLGRQLWSDAVAARDARGDALGAAHRFAQAAAMDVPAKSNTNAVSAADDAVGGVRLDAMLAHDAAVMDAWFNDNDDRILSRTLNGAIRLWDARTGQPIAPSVPLGSDLAGAAFDGSDRLLGWSRDGTLQLWNVASRQPIGRPMNHDAMSGNPPGTSPPTDAAFVPNRDRVVSISQSGGTIVLWNSGTQKHVAVMKHEQVRDLFVSSDGTSLVTLSSAFPGTVRIWDLGTAIQRGRTIVHNGVHGGAISKDGTKLLTWGSDRAVRIWDMSTQEAIGEAVVHDSEVTGAAFVNGDHEILSWAVDGKVNLWDAATRQRAAPAIRHDGQVHRALLDAAGRLALTVRGVAAYVWDVRRSRRIGAPLTHREPLFGAAISHDGSRIMTWGRDQTIRVWRVERRSSDWTATSQGKVTGAMFNAARTRVLTWDSTGTARQWAADTGAGIGDSMHHGASIKGATFSPDGNMILTWSDDGGMQLWDANATGVAPRHGDELTNLTGVVFMASGARFVAWTGWGTIREWEPAAQGLTPVHSPNPSPKGRTPMPGLELIGKLGASDDFLRALDSPMRHDGSVTNIELDATGNRILSWGLDGTARLWNSASGETIGAPMHHESTYLRPSPSVVDAVFDDRAGHIITRGTDDAIRVWVAATGKAVDKIQQTELEGSAFNGPTRAIWTWTKPGTIMAWDADTLKANGQPIAAGVPLNGVLLDREARRILTWGGTAATVWGISTRQPMGPRMEHGSAVGGAEFISAAILTWSADGVIRLWDAATEQPIKTWAFGPVTGVALDCVDERLLAWGPDKSVRMIALRPPPKSRARVAKLEVEVWTGTRLLPTGEVEALSAAEWDAKRQQLRDTMH